MSSPVGDNLSLFAGVCPQPQVQGTLKSCSRNNFCGLGMTARVEPDPFSGLLAYKPPIPPNSSFLKLGSVIIQ